MRGRKAKAIVIRELSAIRIVFFNHETIYVFDRATAQWHCFHRWFGGRGSYNGGWRQFRHLLFYEKSLDVAHCYRLAFRWDIASQVVRAGPELANRAIEIRDMQSSKPEH